MQFTTTAVLALAGALTASAAPQTTQIPEGKTFSVTAIAADQPFNNQPLQAARTKMIVGATSQNASCDATTNSANFAIRDGELFLYAASATPQKFFVDRSGMGMSSPHFPSLPLTSP
jgi:hypothetical protein